MTGIEEAWGPTLRGRAALEQRLRIRHRIAPLLERLGHGGEILRPLRTVEDLTRPLVGLDRLPVSVYGLLRDVRHLDVYVERPDVVSERDEIILRRRPDLFPFAPAARLESEERQPAVKDSRDRPARALLRPGRRKGSAIGDGLASGGHH